jgi:hypothetical protein
MIHFKVFSWPCAMVLELMGNGQPSCMVRREWLT